MAQDAADLPDGGIERADVEAALGAAPHRHHPAVRVLGTLSEIADQPQLTTLCSAVALTGRLTADRNMLRAGLQMLAAHVVANSVKRVIKTIVRRTRPQVVEEEGRYRRDTGPTVDGAERSFPSGHAAGAVAVAGIVAHRYPALRVPAFGAAAVVAVVQVPRAKHYPADVVAGAALGLVAAWAVTRVWDRFDED